MRIAVTGASGFVGGAVCRAAAEAGWTVHAFGRRPTADRPPEWLASTGVGTSPRARCPPHPPWPPWCTAPEASRTGRPAPMCLVPWLSHVCAGLWAFGLKLPRHGLRSESPRAAAPNWCRCPRFGTHQKDNPAAGSCGAVRTSPRTTRTSSFPSTPGIVPRTHKIWPVSGFAARVAGAACARPRRRLVRRPNPRPVGGFTCYPHPQRSRLRRERCGGTKNAGSRLRTTTRRRAHCKRQPAVPHALRGMGGYPCRLGEAGT